MPPTPSSTPGARIWDPITSSPKLLNVYTPLRDSQTDLEDPSCRTQGYRGGMSPGDRVPGAAKLLHRKERTDRYHSQRTCIPWQGTLFLPRGLGFESIEQVPNRVKGRVVVPTLPITHGTSNFPPWSTEFKSPPIQQRKALALLDLNSSYHTRTDITNPLQHPFYPILKTVSK